MSVARFAAVDIGWMPAPGDSVGCVTGRAPLAARSAISSLTASGDVDGGSRNWSTIVAPAGSAAQPNGVMHIRSDSARTKDRTGTGRCLTKGFQIIGASSTIQVHDLFSRNVGQPARNSSSFAYRANGPECCAARVVAKLNSLRTAVPASAEQSLRPDRNHRTEIWRECPLSTLNRAVW